MGVDRVGLQAAHGDAGIVMLALALDRQLADLDGRFEIGV
jgi:hypothetical protein